MLIASATRIAARSKDVVRRPLGRRLLSSSTTTANARREATKVTGTMIAGAFAIVASSGLIMNNDQQSSKYSFLAARIPTSGDVLSVGSVTKEPATGISFPALCNGMALAGVGVRIKYVFVKVYAVGTYLDPIAMMAVKKGGPANIQKALLDPTYPRTIRIVMNRGLSIDKYTAAIMEAIEPRLKGQELETLEEFKKLNPPVDLVEGAEIEMTIRGDSMLYKNAVGGVGSMKSRLFMEAMCDVFYGDEPVSPPHKESVLKGIPNL